MRPLVRELGITAPMPSDGPLTRGEWSARTADLRTGLVWDVDQHRRLLDGRVGLLPYESRRDGKTLTPRGNRAREAILDELRSTRTPLPHPRLHRGPPAVHCAGRPRICDAAWTDS